jgi:pyruvate,water dikinase
MTAAHTRPLTELRHADASQFGGKSTSLGELIAGEIPVPGGFAVSTSAFAAFVAEDGLAERIAATLEGLDHGDVTKVTAAADAIAAAIGAAAVPAAVCEAIAAGYADIADAAGESEPAVAVRSSALGEDSAEATFAGQQETYLWVRGADGVCAAVRDCWASLYSAPALTYRARMTAAGQAPAMGVTVQLMVDAAVSGVMFTCNPVSGDPSMVAVNASWGLGLGVVGGEVTPDDYLVSKVTREIVRKTINAKAVEYVPDPNGSGTVCVPVAAERQLEPCLDEERLRALVDIARRVERYFGGHQDIEWAIAAGEIFVLQARPVTATGAAPPAPKAPVSALSLVMGTFGVGKDR